MVDTRYGIAVDRCRDKCNEPPSFSSTLLDSICRSFDHSAHARPLQSRIRCEGEADGRRSRDRIVHSWIEKTTTTHHEFTVSPLKIKSSSMSSSDSSSALGFSSSDTDSFSANKNKKTSLKPIRTTVSESETDKRQYDGRKTPKSRAMKIYGELKRIKQPISPGAGKVASFLTSLFSPGGNAKKKRISTSKFGHHSSEVLERSESRSCLTKFPRRRNSKSEMELTLQVVESNRKSVEEVAKDLMRNYYKKWGTKDLMNEDGEDAESCCSSDLFELDNLKEIGVAKYASELPVYETTHVNTNRAIASVFIK